MLIENRDKSLLVPLETSVSMPAINENISQSLVPSRLPIGSLLKGSQSLSTNAETLTHPKTMPSSIKVNPTTPQIVSSEAEQVIALMRANIATMLERGDSVAKLSEKSEQLQAQAYRFRVQAQRTERNLWWRNMRMNIAIALLSMIAIGIVISFLVRGSPSSTSTTSSIQKSLSQEPFPTSSKVSKDFTNEDPITHISNAENKLSTQSSTIPPKTLDLN